ncbi:hypothetical protein V1522DRAFT_267901 [Lipomyces starkeyi]
MRFTSLSTGRSGTSIIIEVGISKTMKKLERDAERRLIGLRDEVRVCAVAMLDEKPEYHMLHQALCGLYQY